LNSGEDCGGSGVVGRGAGDPKGVTEAGVGDEHVVEDIVGVAYVGDCEGAEVLPCVFGVGGGGGVGGEEVGVFVQG
jgi:hypothetical protein